MDVVETVVTVACSGGLTAAGMWYLKYRDQTYVHKSQSVEQAAAHEKEVIGQLQGFIAMLQADIEQLRDDGRERDNKHENDFRELHTKHIKCQVENEGLRSRLDIQQGMLENLRAGMDPVFSSILTPMANVVADEDGTIINASPFIFSMFHWSESELKGRNVKRLIPPRFHKAHDDGMEKVRRTGVMADNRVYRLTGITKQGEEFPISLKLEGWKDGGRWFFSAYIQKRSGSDDGSASNAELPTAKAPVEVVIMNSPDHPVPNKPVEGQKAEENGGPPS